jgi:hypothetical protein
MGKIKLNESVNTRTEIIVSTKGRNTQECLRDQYGLSHEMYVPPYFLPLNKGRYNHYIMVRLESHY